MVTKKDSLKLKYLNNSTFVKTILMLLVIAYHSGVFWTGKWWGIEPDLPSNSLCWIADWLNSFHIYAFTLVSGYLFAYKVLRGSYNVYSSFLRNKVKRLIIPYCFIAIVWLIPISVMLFETSWDKIVKAYLLCITPDQLWFLWMLFGVFAIVWPFKKVVIEKRGVSYVIAIVFWGIGIVGNRLIPNVFCIWTSCQYVIFFLIGMRIRVKEERRESLVTAKVSWYCWGVVDLVIFVGTIIIERNRGAVWSLMRIGLNFILHIVGAIMAWTTLQMLGKKVHWQSSRVFATLSLYSMPVYLFHQQIIYFTILWLNGKVNPWINAVMNFAVALAGSFLLSSVLMRWKVTRFLIGEK